MIRLTKGAKPQVLVDNAAGWTAEILRKIGEGSKVGDAVGRRYAHQDIKLALLAETHGKCAYCEAKILHIAFGDIEHIVAKKPRPELAVEWTNLTIACDRCNQSKSDLDGVLDPYSVDPEDHLVFLGPLVRSKAASDLGELSVRILELNRPALVERRTERIDAVLAFLRLAERAVDIRLKRELIADARRCSAPSEEYSVAVASALAACGVDRAEGHR
ncbi:hypothetical protein GOY17_07280 [Lysobacter soli]|uniref:HNH endonuclease n=1 Tax=Lysobacter soli TaxID=453783 RepID=UPI0012EDA55C|nr:HNH endonuclease [Lysobacter soli]QGW64735.1 hypothetical protein GOY17_07280 [Lysobacter soli]